MSSIVSVDSLSNAFTGGGGTRFRIIPDLTPGAPTFYSGLASVENYL